MYKKLLIVIIFFMVAGSSYAIDLTLKDSVDMALKKNPELAAAYNSYQSNSYKVTEMRSNYWPQLSANFLASRRVSPLSLTFGENLPAIPGLSDKIDVINYSAGVSLQQNIWDFGRTGSLTKKTALNREISYLTYSRKKQEVIYNVRKNYYQLLAAKAMQQIALLNANDLEKLLESVQERQKEGLATLIDVLNAEQEYLKMQSQVTKSSHQIELAKATLANSIGITTTQEINIAEIEFNMPEEAPLNIKSQAEAKEKALSQRLEFTELTLQNKMASAAVQSVYSEWLPAISASGEYDLRDTVFPPEQNTWSASLNVTLPLFNGFASKSRLKSSRKDLESVEYTREQARDNILAQVELNYYKVVEEKENAAVTGKTKKYQEINLQATTAKYNEGLSSLTDLIEAQTNKSSADFEMERALFSYHMALNELEFSVGGLK